MKFSRLLYSVLFFLVLSLPAYAIDNETIEGVFTEVSGKNFAFDGKKVEIIEFFSFYCGHCYQFERSAPVINGNFPGKIKWKYIPIYWGKGSSRPGEAYLLAKEAGKGEEMKKAIFDAFFLNSKDIGNVEVLEDIAAEIGLGFDFSRKLRAGAKAADAKKAMDMIKEYNVNETPTIIIAGNLKSSPGLFNGNIFSFRENTITILKSLFKK